MPITPPTICSVTGVCRDLGGNALSGVTIVARNSKPFIHPTDGSIINPFQLSTQSAPDGSWDINLVETTTPNVSITITLTYALGSNESSESRDYTVIIPDETTATFSSLIVGEI